MWITSRHFQNRNFVGETIKKIFAAIKTNKVNERADILMEKSFELDPLSNKQAEVYEQAIEAFHKTCFDFNEVSTTSGRHIG